jgi:CDP-diacylglycerol--glycerol-3-phosphate 3-phosphatidyltransferase
MTGPNVLSVVRILLTPGVVWAIVSSEDRWTIALLGLALLSDFLDGWWARRAGLSSELGRVLDPLADKILAGATLVALALVGRVPRELVLVVVARDAILLGLGWIRIRQGRRVPAAELPGKIGFAVLGGYLAGVVLRLDWPAWITPAVGGLYAVTGLVYAKRIPGIPVARAAKGEQ